MLTSKDDLECIRDNICNIDFDIIIFYPISNYYFLINCDYYKINFEIEKKKKGRIDNFIGIIRGISNKYRLLAYDDIKESYIKINNRYIIIEMEEFNFSSLNNMFELYFWIKKEKIKIRNRWEILNI